MKRRLLSILLILMLVFAMPAVHAEEEKPDDATEESATPAPTAQPEETPAPTAEPEPTPEPTLPPETEECAHKQLKREYSEIEKEWAVDNKDGTHTWHVTQHYQDICQKCGKVAATGIEETVGQPEKHLFDETGLCEGCGYQCLHVEFDHQLGTEILSQVCQDNGDGTHTTTNTVAFKDVCKECGILVKEGTEDAAQPAAAHVFDEKGVCKDCGYACPHTGETMAKDTELKAEYKNRSGRHHTKVSTVRHETLCADCQAVLDSWDETEETEEKHKYNKKGKCVCGRKEEKEEETKPADPEMIETLFKLGAELQAKPGTQVEILYMDELLTDSELEALKALPLSDQLMTALCVCGFDTNVSASGRLSPAAAALFGDIRSRLYAMSREEWFEFQKVLDARFPDSVITIDNVNYDAFTLDLKVTENGAERVDRYSFRLAGNTWRLTQKP